jgi:hypothetical protein
VAIGVLVLLLDVKWGYTRHQDYQSEIATYREALRTSSLMLSRTEGLKERIDTERKGLKTLEKGLLKAPRPSMAAAELQEAFKKLIKGKDIAIRSQNVLGFEEVGKYVKIPVEFHLNTELRQLARLLYEIEKSPLVMGVRSMHVTVPYSGEKTKINVTLVLEGAIRSSESAKDGGTIS